MSYDEKIRYTQNLKHKHAHAVLVDLHSFVLIQY